MNNEKIKNILKEKNLKVTPQRMLILEAIYTLNNHPTAEDIIDYIKKMYPHIATGTVYKVLNVLIENELIKKVKTEKDKMRYDSNMGNHHHLYDTESDTIEDYFDEELDKLLKKHFEKQNMQNFMIEDLVLEIKGKNKTN